MNTSIEKSLWEKLRKVVTMLDEALTPINLRPPQPITIPTVEQIVIQELENHIRAYVVENTDKTNLIYQRNHRHREAHI